MLEGLCVTLLAVLTAGGGAALHGTRSAVAEPLRLEARSRPHVVHDMVVHDSGHGAGLSLAEAYGRLSPVVHDMVERLQSSPQGPRQHALLKDLQGFFVEGPPTDRLGTLLEGLARYNGGRASLLQRRRGSGGLTESEQALEAEAEAMGVPGTPAAAPAAAKAAPLITPQVPPPAPAPSDVLVVPPPVAEEMARFQDSHAQSDRLKSSEDLAHSAVDGLGQDMDGVFHFLDQVDHWRDRTPKVAQAVQAFVASYKASLQKLAVAAGAPIPAGFGAVAAPAAGAPGPAAAAGP